MFSPLSSIANFFSPPPPTIRPPNPREGVTFQEEFSSHYEELESLEDSTNWCDLSPEEEEQQEKKIRKKALYLQTLIEHPGSQLTPTPRQMERLKDALKPIDSLGKRYDRLLGKVDQICLNILIAIQERHDHKQLDNKINTFIDQSLGVLDEASKLGTEGGFSLPIEEQRKILHNIPIKLKDPTVISTLQKRERTFPA